MNCLTIMHEIAALAGYTIDASTGEDPSNKTRALRRLNAVKADIISRYGGKWPANYKEGWLPLVPLYNTGAAVFTQGSNTVTGVNTVWTTSMKGYKINAPSNEAYKIASVTNSTTLVLTQPYQGTSTVIPATGDSYSIWKDEYRLYPDVWAVGGFIDYYAPQTMTESWPRTMKDSYPFPASVEDATIYTVLGREALTTTYSAGTVSVSQNNNVWTGSGTLWLANVEPGFEFTVGLYTYHVKKVNSDTELETFQMSVLNVSAGTGYTSKGKNAVVVRFRRPTNQRIVSYYYYVKDYPFVNDNDEDWIAEMFPEVIMQGAVRKDYVDKNDVARASLSKQEYEDAIKNMKVATDAAYTGIRTLGIYVPPSARE